MSELADSEGAEEERGDKSAGGGKSSKDDWLNLAIDILIRDGIDRVKVQIMAKELNVARSSFYWFFQSTDDLRKQMLDVWITKNTGPIVQQAMRPTKTITEAILCVFECWVDTRLFDPRLDIAVRLWARRSEEVRKVVAYSDHQRVDALTKMYERHGFAASEALVRARTLYFTQIGQYTLDLHEDNELRTSRSRDWVVSFCGVEPSEKELAAFAKRARLLAAAAAAS